MVLSFQEEKEFQEIKQRDKIIFENLQHDNLMKEIIACSRAGLKEINLRKG